jgi:ligand-binding sensor domain-containing protein
MRYSVLFYFILCIHFKGVGQDFSSRHYTVKDGLAGTMVYDVLQDKNGFIWFATNQGVSRFDGRNFTNFSKEDGLPDNEILRLYLDKFNNIWFISLQGIPSVYTTKGEIKQFANCLNTLTIIEDNKTDTLQLFSHNTSKNNYQTGTYRSANRNANWKFSSQMQTANIQIDQVNLTPILKFSVKSKFNCYSKLIGVGRSEVTMASQQSSNTYTIYHNRMPDIYNISRNRFFSLAADSNSIIINNIDSLFFVTQNQIKSLIDLKTLGLNINRHDDVNAVFFENANEIWLATRNKGLLCLSGLNKGSKSVKTFFGQSFCTQMIKDLEGGYWVTTLNDGVYYIPNKEFFSITSNMNLANKDIKCIRNYNADELILGSADGGIYRINCKNMSISNYGSWIAANKNNRVLDIWPLKNEQVMIGCDDGLYVAKEKGNSKKIGTFGAVKNIHELSNDNFLIATGGAQMLINLNNNYSKIYSSRRTTCTNGFDNQYFWGTLDGLYSHKNGITENLGNKHTALNGIINRIDIAPDSTIWVATPTGIVLLKNEKITLIKKENGLVSDMCKHVLFNESIAFVATDKGISRIDYQWQGATIKYTISNITEEDGLASNNINQTSLVGDYIWVATSSGLSYFPKNYISQSAMSPTISITKIQLGDSAIAIEDSIVINNATSKLSIELAGISFRSGKFIQYEYRLSGIDDKWIKTNAPKIEFNVLPYGNYELEIRAIDRWGVSSTQAKKIYIIHKAPFWKTTWFTVLSYLLTSIIIGGGVFFYYQRRQRSQEKEYSLKKKLYDLEMMALRSQMNPHFIFNSLNSISNYMLKADVVNANLYLNKFSVLIRNILKHSKNSMISLVEEVKLLQLYLELEKLRLGDKMNFTISLSEGILQEDIKIPSMVIQPFIENALKHGIAPLLDRQGFINVDFKMDKNCLICTIEDNGIGIHNSKKQNNDIDDHHSISTDITKKRIDIINAMQPYKIEVNMIDKSEMDTQENGTVIKLSFPIINE